MNEVRSLSTSQREHDRALLEPMPDETTYRREAGLRGFLLLRLQCAIEGSFGLSPWSR